VNRRRRSKDACARTGALKAGLLFEWAAKNVRRLVGKL
jgi:hypothetical protein